MPICQFWSWEEVEGGLLGKSLFVILLMRVDRTCGVDGVECRVVAEVKRLVMLALSSYQ